MQEIKILIEHLLDTRWQRPGGGLGNDTTILQFTGSGFNQRHEEARCGVSGKEQGP